MTRRASSATGVTWNRRDFAATRWSADQPVSWIGADTADRRRADLNAPAELYNLDAVAYESVMLGLFTIFRGEQRTREKPNDICIGFSRDGFHWDRTSRDAVHLRLGARRRLELGQRAVGRRLLPDRRRPSLFLRERAAGHPRHRSAGQVQHRPGDAAGATVSRRSATSGRPACRARSAAIARASSPGPLKFRGGHLFLNADGITARSGSRSSMRRARSSRRMQRRSASRCAATRRNIACDGRRLRRSTS